MNSAVLWFFLPFCGLILAQNESETEKQTCDMCEFLKVFTAMEQKLQVMETKLRSSEAQIQELKNQGATKVVFSAALGRGEVNVGPFDTDETLIYKKVTMNIGNAYSPYTGAFTAPVSGVYYFSIFYHGGNNKPSKLRLFKNDQMIVMTHHHPTGNVANNGGNAATLQLQRGDTVYVKMDADGYVWGTNQHTTFNGFLISQM